MTLCGVEMANGDIGINGNVVVTTKVYYSAIIDIEELLSVT